MNKIFTTFFISILFVTIANGQSSNYTNEDLQKTNAEIVKLYQQKKFDEALPLAKKAIEIAEQVFGKDSLEMAKALRNLGFIQFSKNDISAAEETFGKAVNTYKKTPNLAVADGINFAETAEYLAFIKYRNQKVDAENIFEMALELFEKNGAKGSIKTSKSLFALANINYWKRNFEKSAKYFGQLFEVAIKNPNNKEVNLTMVYYRAECVYRKAGMEDEFEAIQAQYINNYKKMNSENISQTVGKTINSGVVNGKAINLAVPSYPAEARQARAQGKINVEVLINEEGTVICACAEKKGNAALNEVSEAAAYRSKFTPTLLEGKPVTVTGTIIYNFVP